MSGMTNFQVSKMSPEEFIESQAPSLPKSVAVGHNVYTIHTDHSEIIAEPDGDESLRAGASYHTAHQIWVNTDKAAVEEVKDTLVHEILHCCIAASGLTWMLPRTKRADIEEAYVSALTFPLANVLRDNPDLVDYLSASYPAAPAPQTRSATDQHNASLRRRHLKGGTR